MEIPDTRYAQSSDGLSIAYQIVGDGPIDVLLIPHVPCIDVMWEDQSFAHFLSTLAGIGRLVAVDWRGFGASDPVPLGALPTAEGWMEDFRIVLDAIGSTSVSIVAHGPMSFAAMLFAATYPQRTKAIVLIDPTARALPDDGYPSVFTPDILEEFIAGVSAAWGHAEKAFPFAQSRSQDEPS